MIIYEAPRGSPQNVGRELAAVHPVVRTNPVTGWKSIFAVGSFPRRILELEPEESDELLQKFYRVILDNHDLTVRFKWRNKNDIGEFSALGNLLFNYETDPWEQPSGTTGAPSTARRLTTRGRDLEIGRWGLVRRRTWTQIASRGRRCWRRSRPRAHDGDGKGKKNRHGETYRASIEIPSDLCPEANTFRLCLLMWLNNVGAAMRTHRQTPSHITKPAQQGRWKRWGSRTTTQEAFTHQARKA